MKIPTLFVPIAVVAFALLAFPLKEVFTYRPSRNRTCVR